MRATVALVLVNVVVYVVMMVTSGGEGLLGFDSRTLLEYGADYAPAVIDQAEAWRLYTATLVHINLLHIVFNMFALVQVGRVLEPRWGGPRVILGYVVTGLGGSAASILWYGVLRDAFGLGGRPAIAAGASGAICGLIGATVIAAHNFGGRVGTGIRNAMLRWGLMIVVMGFFIRADNAAHIGGLLVGFLAGFVIERLGLPRDRVEPRPWGRDLAAIGAFVLVSVLAFWVSLTTETRLF